MYIPLTWIGLYLVGINLIAAAVTVWDKQMARRQKWRVSESTLLWLAGVGGCPAMLVTMLLIRHKTRHLKFMLGLPLLVLAQGMLAYLLWRFGCFIG